MNECLMTPPPPPRHEKQIGYWVSEISLTVLPELTFGRVGAIWFAVAARAFAVLAANPIMASVTLSMLSHLR